MTVAEYLVALESLDDAQFAAFRSAFGGDFTTRQQYVDHFVHHPEHEKRLSQLLGVEPEQDKLTAATLSSARAAEASARSARWAMIWAALSVVVAMTALYLSTR